MRYFVLFVIMFLPFHLSGQLDSLLWEDIDRTYLLRIPSDYNSSEEIPLLIAMHGGLGNAFNLENQSQLSVTAENKNFIVVYPEGVRGGILNIRTWNAGWCCGLASNNNVDDVGFINALIDTLSDKYTINSNRIYATGMSNGGFMSYRLACELSDRIAAIAPVAASMSMVECSPDRPIPVIDFHSYIDENVPYQGGEGAGISDHYNSPQDSVLNFWANNSDCIIRNDTIVDNDEFTRIKWTDCLCNYSVEHYITTDGGHSWPGGEMTPVGDPVSNYINANELMWAFFEDHTLECSTVSSSEINASSDISIYPNPANEIIRIYSKEMMFDSKISIYNLQGFKIAQKVNLKAIDISHLDTGTYVIKIENGKQVFTTKFIKTD